VGSRPNRGRLAMTDPQFAVSRAVGRATVPISG
jgi:hypothetical protein